MLEDGVGAVPFVDLDPKHYKLVGGFDAHFPDGVPSLKGAEELVVEGDWTFGAGVTVTGRAHVQGAGGRIDEGATLSG